MPHATPLISTIVAGLVLAFIFGAIANRFRLPPLVGYLFAGILVGPHTPGFVADQALGAELAEIGVILLMFGVGLHFSLRDLMSVRALAIPGALVQIAFATALGLGLGLLMGWGVGAGLLFGLALSVASTVVLLKALQDRRLVETERGRIAVGWLIVEDLAMVLALVLIPAIATLSGDAAVQIHDPFVSFVETITGVELGLVGVIVVTIVKIAAFVGFMLIVGRRAIPWALHATAHTGSRELFRLAVLAIALGVALGSSVLFGVSLALGAFFAGMILSESELSHRAAQETLPLRDAFAVLFFVSVGMLFDPTILLRDPLPVLATVLIIVVGKSLAAFGIVILAKRPVATALTISASLAQIGEFSFILASMGVALAILPQQGQDLILAGALISIVLNPLVFWGVNQFRPALETRFGSRKGVVETGELRRAEPTLGGDVLLADGTVMVGEGEAVLPVEMVDEDDDLPQPTSQSDHTIVVGYGRVGRAICQGLTETGARFLVVEDADSRIAQARGEGAEVVVGNAATSDVLAFANASAARNLLIAIPNVFEAGQATEQGRKCNPTLRIIVRAHSDDEEAHLLSLGANIVVMGGREIGIGMLHQLQEDAGNDNGLESDTGEVRTRLTPGENLLLKETAGFSALREGPLLDRGPQSAPLLGPEDYARPDEPVGGPFVLGEPVDEPVSEDVQVVHSVVAEDEGVVEPVVETVPHKLPAAELVVVEPAAVVEPEVLSALPEVEADERDVSMVVNQDVAEQVPVAEASEVSPVPEQRDDPFVADLVAIGDEPVDAGAVPDEASIADELTEQETGASAPVEPEADQEELERVLVETEIVETPVVAAFEPETVSAPEPVADIAPEDDVLPAPPEALPPVGEPVHVEEAPQIVPDIEDDERAVPDVRPEPK